MDVNAVKEIPDSPKKNRPRQHHRRAPIIPQPGDGSHTNVRKLGGATVPHDDVHSAAIPSFADFRPTITPAMRKAHAEHQLRELRNGGSFRLAPAIVENVGLANVTLADIGTISGELHVLSVNSVRREARRIVSTADIPRPEAVIRIDSLLREADMTRSVLDAEVLAFLNRVSS